MPGTMVVQRYDPFPPPLAERRQQLFIWCCLHLPWPHFRRCGSRDRREISCITCSRLQADYLWFCPYSVHYCWPSVWLASTHSLTCQITASFWHPVLSPGKRERGGGMLPEFCRVFVCLCKPPWISDKLLIFFLHVQFFEIYFSLSICFKQNKQNQIQIQPFKGAP